MSDIKIKDFGIFGNRNKGLDKIKRASETKEIVKLSEEKNTAHETSLNTTLQSTRFIRGVGAPVQNYDQALSAKLPLKLSAVTVALTRILSEKYMTRNSRDEILRLALNDYIKHNLTKEDKIDLISDMKNELNIFHEKYPTMNKYDEKGIIEKNKEQIEQETIEYLRKAWRI